MKDFLETYAHIVNGALAVVVIGFLFYLGSTIKPEWVDPSKEQEIMYFERSEPLVETLPEPEPVIVPEPEPVVELEPVVTDTVKETVEVDIDTVATDTVIEVIEVEIEPIEVPVEVEVDSTDNVDSTHIKHMFTQHFDITVSRDGYLIVPDSVDSIVDAFSYASERIGDDTRFVWRDSTYNGGK